MSLDPLVLILQNDLLTNILAYSEDIGQCASQLTLQIREIIAARAVALFERGPEGNYRLIGVCPDRRQGLFEDERAALLVEKAGRLLEPTLIVPGKGEMGPLLADLAMNESFVVPLRVGQESLGILLVLDLMDQRGIEKILDALKEISGLLSLILKSSFLYRNLETLVEQRTLALRMSETRAWTILETAMDGFWVLDRDGTVMEVNDSYCAMSGYSRHELLTMNAQQVEAVEADTEVLAHIHKILAGKHDRFETVHRRKDGSLMSVEISAQRRPGSEGEIFAFIRDMTEHKQAEAERHKLQDQLAQAQKMESVGRLAGGVAHDFNNMLGVILGHTEMAMEQIDQAQPLYADLEEIKKAARRSADLTRQLLAFARKQTVSPRVLDLNETVEGMLKMLRRLIGEDIDLVWLPGKNLWPVNVDPSQIDQILANLCVNARDAIEGVGKVTMETGNVHFDEVHCANRVGFVPGDYVRLAVSDDGSGMEKETLDRLFEPFFTTKEVGKGTGLGLATIYGIVKQNNGCIDVQSEPNQGTTLAIYLPRHVGESIQDRREGLGMPVQRGGETVLLVEDEPSILNMGKAMLERLGYRVLTAGKPGDAIRMVEEYPGVIHLLMTDVVMPEMDGKELAERLLFLCPNLKRLFMSGYTSDVIAHHGVLDQGIQFIQKPFSWKELSVKVRETLDQT